MPRVRNANTSASAHLWRARYTVRFSSSSGMKPYHQDEERTEYVAVHGDSISDVMRAIEETLCSQSSLRDIHEAHWLGRLL